VVGISKLTFDKLADILIKQETEQVSIPMRFLLQFNKFFDLGEDGIISAKTIELKTADGVAEIPVMSMPMDLRWSINFEREGVSEEDLKLVIIETFKSFMSENLTDAEYSQRIQDWQEEVKQINLEKEQSCL